MQMSCGRRELGVEGTKRGHDNWEAWNACEGRQPQKGRLELSLFLEPGEAAKGFFKLQANMVRFVFHKDYAGCSVEKRLKGRWLGGCCCHPGERGQRLGLG